MPLTIRTMKTAAKAGFRRVFEAGQHLGVDLLPRHFYSEIPDIRQLRRSNAWKRRFSMCGVAGTDIDSQLAFVRQHISPVVHDVLRRRDIHAEASAANGETGYGSVEARFLYAFIVTRKPRTIFQIGCGVSTMICLLAAKDADYRPEIICVEPFPTQALSTAARKGTIKLHQTKAQDLELEIIESLDNDLLFFVDSTHTLGPAGEVSRIVLEMLPRLKAGAQVHFHDIMFPYDYSRDVLEGALVFQHESVLLHSFLAYNSRFVLRAALSMLHYAAPERLAELVPGYVPAANDEGLGTTAGHFPSSAYMEVVA